MQTIYLLYGVRTVVEVTPEVAAAHSGGQYKHQQCAVGGGFEVVLVRRKGHSLSGRIGAINAAACAAVQANGGHAGQLKAVGPCAPLKPRKSPHKALRAAHAKTIPMFRESE